MHRTSTSSQDVTFLSLFFGSMPYTALRNADVGSLACSRCAGRSLSPPGYLCTSQHAQQPIALSSAVLPWGYLASVCMEWRELCHQYNQSASLLAQCCGLLIRLHNL